MNIYILESAGNTASYGEANNKNELEEKFGDAKEIGARADFHTTLLLKKPKRAFLVSQTMVDKIGDTLLQYGELLPIKILGRNQNFYQYNCTNIIDCFDYEQSTYSVIKSSFLKKRISIRKPIFLNKNIGDSMIFTVPKTASPIIFVTEKFKNTIIENKLTGIKLMNNIFDFDCWES